MVKNISTIMINASAQKVWEAITNPELVKLWQYGSELQTTWEIGSQIKFRSQWQDKVFEQWGKVLEVTPYSLVRYSLFAPSAGVKDVPENYFIMNYILTAAAGQTKLEIVQEDNRPTATQEDPQVEENPVLQSLKQVVEAQV